MSLSTDTINKANYLIFKFDFKSFNFEHLENGQPYVLNYEKKRYRQDELVDLIFSALPYFALTENEFADFKARSKAPRTYMTEATKNITRPGVRAGDYGELLLFMLLEIFYKSKKLVTKVHYKTSQNMPVFGADASHFTREEDGSIAFWFGESKIYQDFNSAINKAFDSVDTFLQTKIKGEVEFLTPERIEINKNVDSQLYNDVVNLIEGRPSLDDLNIKIPILITYEEEVLSKFSDISDTSFINGMNSKFVERFNKIKEKKWQKYYKNVSFTFLLLPIQNMKSFKELIKQYDDGNRI